MFFNVSISAMLPHMCTGITHFVFDVMAAFTATGSSVRDSSISTKTGIAPTEITASKLATKVNAGIITSSPKPIPNAAIAVVRAAVPLLNSWAYLHPKVSVIFCSSSFAFQFPLRCASNPYRIRIPVLITSSICFLSSSPKNS